MKILLIGGSGNLSEDCFHVFTARGHKVSVVTRGRAEVPAGCRAFRADRTDAAAMREVCRAARPEVVVNFLGFEVADVALDHAVFEGVISQYVFISSATVYSKPPQSLPVTEEAPLGNPLWDYAQRKVECERWLTETGKRTGFPVTIVRPSHTYSKRWLPNPVASSSYTYAARLAAGKPVFVPDDGENPWTLTAARDFASGVAGLIGQSAAVGEAFHITSDEVLTWNQIVAEIAAAVGATAPIVLRVPTDVICKVVPSLSGNLRGDKSHPGVFDNSKIRRFVPGFQCPVPFREGVRESAAWLRAHPEHQHLSAEVDAQCDAVAAAWAAK